MLEDDSYSVHFLSAKGFMKNCKAYHECKVIKAPFATAKVAGGAGWLFSKRSPYLPVFQKYYREAKETGALHRLWQHPKYTPNALLPDQICEELDGEPIGMDKAFSLFMMLCGGGSLSLLILL